jgi:hypothetical protein
MSAMVDAGFASSDGCKLIELDAVAVFRDRHDSCPGEGWNGSAIQFMFSNVPNNNFTHLRQRRRLCGF